VDMSDVLRAARVLAPHLPPTPMWTYPALDALTGATVYVKHENVQPIGAFKVRGGLNLLAGMAPAERERGVVTNSTGNHAQSIAYACRLFGVRSVVVMPADANEAKVRAVRGLGGEVVLHGADMGQAQVRAEELARAHGLRLVSPGDEPALLAGVGTLYVEMLTAVPDLDAIVVPVGSGTGAAVATVVAAALAPACEVIGVQSLAAPAAYASWRAGRCVRRRCRTAVEGLATARGYELPQRLMRARLAGFLLVPDGEIARAQTVLATHAHTLAEGAGAAGLAAVLAAPERFAGRRIGLVCTGGNASAAEIAALAPVPPAPEDREPASARRSRTFAPVKG
jgi:threonine dehydratase